MQAFLFLFVLLLVLLPAVFLLIRRHRQRCAESAGDAPLGHLFAAETVCFLGFTGYLRQPQSSLGRAALRVLLRALEGLRYGVPADRVADARLGEQVEAIWDSRAEGA